jgi:hypothetical protein
MPVLSLPAIWMIVMLLCTNGIAGIMWFVKATEAKAYKERAGLCVAKHEAFVEQAKAAGRAAEDRARAVDRENRRIQDETAKGWAAALDVVRADRLRIARSSTRVSPVPEPGVTTTGIDGPAAEHLPPPERVLADCAETTLTLVWLQHWVKESR